MSVHVYTGPRAGRHRSTPGLRVVPAVLAAVTIALQICWPLTDGSTRDLLTVLSVITFLLAVGSHAVLVRGVAWALGWAVAATGIGLAVEVLGVHTGLPFGEYAYTGRLGPAVLGVPVVIALAWAMM
ncbi:MAG TPA: carotenoid biosynthesis protein, partial [Candidatus Nanopelagicales bacterium]|nr:carotenoid biosynthesis protein [Candidatus Nanopelagicales bacterium]